jgi:hypothetical protein
MDKVIINHQGNAYKIWMALIVILEVVSSLIYATYSAYRRVETQPFSAIAESIFAIDILVHFLLSHDSSHKTGKYTIRSFRDIVEKYLHGDFVWDIIPLIPLQLIELENDAGRVFYIIKVMRLRKCLKKASILGIIRGLALGIKSNNERKVERGENLFHDHDYNKLNELVAVRLFLRMLKMVVFMVLLTYFAAMLFRIFIGIQDDIIGREEVLENNCSSDPSSGYFMSCYNMYDKTVGQDLIAMQYYAFTTLTTVGFGDFNPKSNMERLFIAAFMLFGVACFSYILGTFIEVFD